MRSSNNIDKLKRDIHELKRKNAQLEAEMLPKGEVLDDIRKLLRIRNELKEEIVFLDNKSNLVIQSNRMVRISDLTISQRLSSFLANNNIVYTNTDYCFQLQELKTIRSLGAKSISELRLALTQFVKNEAR